MATTYKVLAQSNPAATTLTDVYTVPALTSTIVSNITIVNRSGTARTIRVAIAVAGVADAVKQYLYYDMSIPKNTTFSAVLGITLATTDVIRVYASTTDLSFSFFGSEIT